jgi:hypothetical protein
VERRAAGGVGLGVAITMVAVVVKIAPLPATLPALSTRCEPTFSTTTWGIRADAQSVL